MTAVIRALEDAWRRSDDLFAILKEEAWLERPIPLRHPFLFYLGHLPAFAWNQIARGVLDRPPFNPEFDELFERGIDPLDEEEAATVAIHEWPERPAVLAYRDQVRQELLDLVPAVEAIGENDVLTSGLRCYHVVLEHELMHHETLTYLLHELDHALKNPVPDTAPRTGTIPERHTISIPAGTALIGSDFDVIAFGWDNEIPERSFDVAPFNLDENPIAVGEFFAFVEDGGYQREELWQAGDWAWIQRENIQRPHHWRQNRGVTQVRGFSEWLPVDTVAAWPAIVTYAEALAFANWSGARLPTEPELYHAAYGTPEGHPDGSGRPYPWGDEAPNDTHGNFGGRRFDPLPIGTHPAGKSAFGVADLVGNGWEWTSTVFDTYEGFTPWLRTYPGYSQDFFDGEHQVLFGAAWPTDERLLRKSFRNWFQRRYPWAFTTFRLVRS